MIKKLIIVVGGLTLVCATTTFCVSAISGVEIPLLVSQELNHIKHQKEISDLRVHLEENENKVKMSDADRALYVTRASVEKRKVEENADSWIRADYALSLLHTAFYSFGSLVVAVGASGICVYALSKVRSAYLESKLVWVDRLPYPRMFVMKNPEVVASDARIQRVKEGELAVKRASFQPQTPLLTTFNYSPTITRSPALTYTAQTKKVAARDSVTQESETQAALGLVQEGQGKIGGHDNQHMSENIFQVMQDLGIYVNVSFYRDGPQVSTYSIEPSRYLNKKGKVTRMPARKISLAKEDLALALKAESVRLYLSKTGDLRGKIVCELPTAKRKMVAYEDVEIDQDAMLPVVVGVSSLNESVTIDLADGRHMLAAGATGMGKSVVLRNIIRSLLKADPNMVKLIMLDPKVVELSPYAQAPHVAMVETDMDEALGTLEKVVELIDYRLDAFSEYNVQDLKAYNEVADEPMPFIVLVVDELADLLDTHGKEVEKILVRIAQIGRAPGIVMVLATQRPDSDTIPARMRANIVVRVCLSCVSEGDSRTILGQSGGQDLLDKGDSLVMSPELGLVRVQTAFTTVRETLDEVEATWGIVECSKTSDVPLFPVQAQKAFVAKTPEEIKIEELVKEGKMSNTNILIAVYGHKGGKKHKERMDLVKHIRTQVNE